MNMAAVLGWSVPVAASVLLGAVGWYGGRWLHARLQLSDGARAYWLLVWSIAALPPILAIVLQVLLPAPVSEVLRSGMPLPLLDDAGWLSAAVAAEPLADDRSLLSADMLGAVLCALYLSAVALLAAQQLRGTLAIARIVAGAVNAAPSDMPGPACIVQCRHLQAQGIALRLSQARIGPFAVAYPRRCIVLPAALCAELSDTQLQMLLQHEMTHLLQRDPLRAALMRWVQLLLWFNPWLPRIAERVQTAAELRCDAAALALPGGDRRAYAQAYLRTLRLFPASASNATAFSADAAAQSRMRLQHILQGDAQRRFTWRMGGPLVALLLLFASAASALQLHTGVAASGPGDATTTAAMVSQQIGLPVASSTPVPQFQWPLATPKISSRYGHVGGPHSRPHRGLDFAGRRGTTVMAPAAGVVVAATTHYRDAPNYGTVVVLDHGNGWQTLYAHLQDYAVTVGQQVAAGEKIASLGASGRATGPHVHLEILHNGERVDPEPLLR